MKLDEPAVVSDVQVEVPVCTNFAALAAGEEQQMQQQIQRF